MWCVLSHGEACRARMGGIGWMESWNDWEKKKKEGKDHNLIFVVYNNKELLN